MEFGIIPVQSARGAILAHSLTVRDGVLKKGLVLDDEAIARLTDNDIDSIYAVRLAATDIHENEAAEMIAKKLAGENVRVEATTSGRANLFAGQSGVVEIAADTINRLNRLDESLTVACLMPFERVEKGQMLATVKIIPYAVSKTVMDKGLAVIGDTLPVAVQAFASKRVGLIITRLENTKQSLVDKTEEVMLERITGAGCVLGRVSVVAHDANAISLALNTISPHHDVALVFGASAIVDRADVVPVAVEQVGGVIEHLGMPVDPGNLLLLACIGDMPVIGVPTCARSLKRNGFDWVLERLLAGIEVKAHDLQDMGVGGLLKEIPSRPHPRANRQDTPNE